MTGRWYLICLNFLTKEFKLSLIFFNVQEKINEAEEDR